MQTGFLSEEPRIENPRGADFCGAGFSLHGLGVARIQFKPRRLKPAPPMPPANDQAGFTISRSKWA
jgi:hypothetical protein